MRKSRPLSASLLAVMALVSWSAGRGVAAAPEIAAERQVELAVTITSPTDSSGAAVDADAAVPVEKIPGFAVVRERRTVDLRPGRNAVRLEGVADALDSRSVMVSSLTHPDEINLLSVSFERGAAASPDAMLRQAVGHEVIINRKPPMSRMDRGDRATPPETINAKLLAFDEKVLVIETPNRQLPIEIIPRNDDISEIKLLAREGPGMKAALNCEIEARNGGPERIETTYTTRGVAWQAHYIAVVSKDGTTARFFGSVSLTNASGLSFHDVPVRLVGTSRSGQDRIYDLKQRIELPTGTARQWPLLAARPRVAVSRVLGSEGGGPEWIRSHGPTPAGVYLELKNTEGDAPGPPLPAGQVRIYREEQDEKSADAVAPALAGNGALPPVGAGEPFRLPFGRDEAVTVERQAADPPADGAAAQRVEVTIRNTRQEPARLTLSENLGQGGELAESSEPPRKPPQGGDASKCVFDVEVPAGGAKRITYSLRRHRVAPDIP